MVRGGTGEIENNEILDVLDTWQCQRSLWQGQLAFVLATSQKVEKAQGRECYLWNIYDSSEDTAD